MGSRSVGGLGGPGISGQNDGVGDGFLILLKSWKDCVFGTVIFFSFSFRSCPGFEDTSYPDTHIVHHESKWKRCTVIPQGSCKY